jgi:pSer/pThr/pTyr-binding forkhead associated (FHA) protein
MGHSSICGRWYLQGSIDGVTMPNRYRLAAFPTRIGRRGDLDLVLPVPHVSAVHAEIFEREGRLWVRDTDSANGTWLNSVRVEKQTPLGPGDVLRLANLEFVVELGDSPALDRTP